MYIGLGFVSGLVLGTVFFGGLFFSVRWLPKATYPGVMMLITILIRMAVLLLGLYALSAWGLWAMVSALVGILLVRMIMVKGQKRLVKKEKGDWL